MLLRTCFSGKKIKCAQHNDASPLHFFFNIAALKTSFWACPLKIDHIKLNACDVYSLEAHLEVYFSGCLPEETFIDAHQKLHFRNIGRHLLNPLLLEHRHLEDVFLGTPSEDRQNKTEYMWRILSRSSFGSFFFGCCVPEETHIDAHYSWKTIQKF